MLDERQFDAFLSELEPAIQTGLVLSGDIADGQSLLRVLQRFDERLTKPVWFVLGNHDYYGTSIAVMREQVRAFSRSSRHTKWLPDVGCVSLSEFTGLVGHGGWGDGGYGDFIASTITLNDYRFIEELILPSKVQLKQRLGELGREAADYLEVTLTEAFRRHDEVILLTHVPPYVESCWHEGEAVLNEWTPHFSCRAVGERLRSVMQANPTRRLHVLCGHTHSYGDVQILDNLRVTTGGAVYQEPALQAPVPFRS